MNWDDVRTFLAVERHGAVTGAAGELGCNPSTVTRRLTQLEARLGVKLLERRKTGYAVTPAGDALKEEAAAIEMQMVALAHRVSASEQRLQGRVIFSAPAALSGRLLVPHLPAFRARYPGIVLEIIDDDLPLDVNRREADVVLRATSNPPDQLLGNRIAESVGRPYGSPGYLDATSDPGAYALVVSEGSEDAPLRQWAVEQGLTTALRSSSRELRIRAACAGIGLCFLPEAVGDAEPGLVRVPGQVPTHAVDVWLLTHPDLRMSARVRAVQEFVASVVPSRSGRPGIPDAST